MSETPKRETWKDWLPPGEPEPDVLFTRDAITDMANAMRPPKPIKPSDIRVWESRGILPRPIRRRHGNAQYALYPEWQANLARQVRVFQRQGYTLDEIKPRIRTHARVMFGLGDPADLETIRKSAGQRVVTSPEDLTLSAPMVTELEQLAAVYELMTGENVVRAEVHLIADNGHAIRYPLPLASTPEDDDIESD